MRVPTKTKGGCLLFIGSLTERLDKSAVIQNQYHRKTIALKAGIMSARKNKKALTNHLLTTRLA